MSTILDLAPAAMRAVVDELERAGIDWQAEIAAVRLAGAWPVEHYAAARYADLFRFGPTAGPPERLALHDIDDHYATRANLPEASWILFAAGATSTACLVGTTCPIPRVLDAIAADPDPEVRRSLDNNTAVPDSTLAIRARSSDRVEAWTARFRLERRDTIRRAERGV